MADLTVTAANVLLISGTPFPDQRAGVAISQGDAVYQADDGTWLKAKASGTDREAGYNNYGIALSSAANVGGRLSVAGPGCTVALGVGAVGVVYVISATAGKIAPVADLVSTNRLTVLGVGIASNRIVIPPGSNYVAGAVLP